MRAFTCGVCGADLYFENSVCGLCATPTGYDRSSAALVPLVERGRYVDPAGYLWQPCANRDVCGCNWLAPSWQHAPTSLCFSCSLTRVRPADDDRVAMAAFATAEFAKRRLIYSLDRLRLPITPRDEVTAPTGLAFELLSSAQVPVVTGHHNGLIVLDLAESDDAHRERLRLLMGEPYRTVLGHFRHEIGHYYWALLVGGTSFVASFRERFGDERRSYDDAVGRHYLDGDGVDGDGVDGDGVDGDGVDGDGVDGDGTDWRATHISRYATMHPWEDFAEVFAHYLHICDTLETAAAYDVSVGVPGPTETFEDVVTRCWLPLTRGLNQVNRSMGKGDLYPFVLAQPIIAKLSWVADLVARSTP